MVPVARLFGHIVCFVFLYFLAGSEFCVSELGNRLNFSSWSFLRKFGDFASYGRNGIIFTIFIGLHWMENIIIRKMGIIITKLPLPQ